MKQSENVIPLDPNKQIIAKAKRTLTIGKIHFFIVLFFTGFYSHAQLSKIPLAQRVNHSDLIVEGQVTAKRSFWNPDHTMIYTASTVEIFKIFKGDVSAASIEILTEGGVVGESMITVKPSLSPEIGDLGIFTCEHVKRFKPGRQKSALPQYEVYASVQGFIRYDLATKTASDVFSTYRDIENALYKKLLPKGTASYLTIRNFDIHARSASPISPASFSPASISAGAGQYIPIKKSDFYTNSASSLTMAAIDFTPTTVSAGTGSTITITGSGFGATQGSGFVSFGNAENGSITFITPLPSQYISWTDTEIIVEVPTLASTGPIYVTQGLTKASIAPLTITYSHLNVILNPGSGTIAYQVDHATDNGAGGYTFMMNTSFDANAPAKAALMRALDTWRCNTGVNWVIGGTTSVNNPIGDGTNLITFDDAHPLNAGVLGVAYIRSAGVLGCSSGPVKDVWWVSEIDIILDDGSYINPLTWQYGPSTPSFGEYDFESFCLQLLGRAHLLGWVNDPSSVMHWELPSGTVRRTPSSNDLAGANFVQAKSIVANLCGPGPMTTHICNTVGPTDIVLSNPSVSENVAVNTVVGTLTSTDPDASTAFTYSLVAGSGDTDNPSFNINGNELRVSGSLDFETKNSYSVRISSTDHGGLSYEKTFTIAITNVNEVPTELSPSVSAVDENVAPNTVVGTLSTVDPDAANTFTYTLVAGTGDEDNSYFNISGNSLRITNSPDFEYTNWYSVRIRTTDQGGLPYEEIFTVTISDINEAPINIHLSASSISEDAPDNATVGTLSTVDPDIAIVTFTYTLVAGTGDDDNGNFNISGNSLQILNVPDSETKSSYSVRIRTADQGGLPYEEIFTITINYINKAPADIVLSASSINENVADNSTVGTLSTIDPDGANTFTYALVAGSGDDDNSYFNISGNSLRIKNSPDFEYTNLYSVRIRTTDQGGLPYEEIFTVTISDINEAPIDIGLSASSISEDAPDNATVGTLSTVDPDIAIVTFTYTLVAGTGDDDNGNFNISGNSLQILNVPDSETKSSYSVRIRTTDQGGLPYEEIFTITINYINEAPADIALSASSINENVAPNTVVGTLSTIDPDAANTFTYTLVAGTGGDDSSYFNINGNSLRITNTPGFEHTNWYSVRIRTTDQEGLTYEEIFNITISDINEAPINIHLSASSISEDAPDNATVGTLSTVDPDIAIVTFTYTLVAGTGDDDNGNFNISGNSLQILNSPDFETNSSFSVRIRTADQEGLTYEEIFTITINNINEAPADIDLSASSINENVAGNATVGTLSTIDPDAANTFTYTLVAGTGDDDNSYFNISGNNLQILNSPDFETKSSYSVRIRTTDQGGLLYEEIVTIMINNTDEGITNMNEAPTDLSLSASTLDENEVANTFVGILSTTDPDVGDTFTYSLVAGAGDDNNTAFNISGNELRISKSPDFEISNSYTARIRTTDQGGLFYEETFIIAINDLMENMEINNYMSPNGDGKNDRWEIRGPLNFSGCDVKILNRFGNVVYESKGYDNAWDGTRNGKGQPAGVYYYVISCPGNGPVTGDITLIR